MAIACYRCGKEVKSNVVRVCPAKFLELLGLDFARAYHPKCYGLEKAEAESLIKDVTGKTDPFPLEVADEGAC